MVLAPTISPWPCFIYPPLSTILICGYVHHRHCGVAMDCRGNIISGGTPNLTFLKPFYSTVHHLSVLLYIYILTKAKSQVLCLEGSVIVRTLHSCALVLPSAWSAVLTTPTLTHPPSLPGPTCGCRKCSHPSRIFPRIHTKSISYEVKSCHCLARISGNFYKSC